MTMADRQETRILTNARIILAEAVIDNGWIAIVGDKIAELGEGEAPDRGEDMGGDLLMPGLIELHTDHLEAHYVPRPKVYWNPVSAVISYDGQLATSGITTVLDSLRVWREEACDGQDGEAMTLAKAIATARDAKLLRADHYLHLRCEVPMPGVVSEAASLFKRPEIRLASLMDHTPGQRQFRDEDKLRTYYRGKNAGMSEADLDHMFATRIAYQKDYGRDNHRALVEMAQRHFTPLASHDDTTYEHVEQAVGDGVSIAEFPTTLEAAEALHAAGVRVMMGAPNLVRGGSHSGNIATADLARSGILDILSSDYVPSSLLSAAVAMPSLIPGIDLPTAIRTVTKTPANAVGFHDRGEVVAGKRADLIRVHVAQDAPAVRAVWRAGERVA
jgi:alpha-D-ribose 1-methylphosphonate 5-triphosphate diphosphatase